MTQPVLSPGQSYVWRDAQTTQRYRPSTGSWLAVQGACLSPFLIDGDAIYMDPTVEPCDGDLVVARITYVLQKRVSSYGRTPAEDVYVPTKTEKRLSAKALRIIDGERWLVTANDGAQRLDDLDAQLLGTVTAWHRVDEERRPSMEALRRLPIPALMQRDEPHVRELLGPAPCQGCTHAARCRDERMACDQFQIFASGAPQSRWSNAPRAPTRERWLALFDE